MVRSMYSGVSGLRTHQTRMDTIGNNIANVNTYGFKAGRTTFRDIYYQTMSSASAPSAAAGGMNPNQIGYGSQVGSIDIMMERSTFSMTDNTMDVAIDGDGFFQVQDGGGNIYYTRAGMLNFDAVGNLVDMQGNYVLGINGDPTGREAGSERITVNLPPVPPTASSVVQNINNNEFTISTTNPTSDGNLNLNFSTKQNIPDGEVVAEITTTGISLYFNPDNFYADWGELNDAINNAIDAANGGPHAAGTFTIAYTGDGEDPFPAEGLTAKEICSTDYSIQKTTPSFNGKSFFGGIYPTGVGNTFGENFADGLEGTFESFEAEFDDTTEPKKWVFKLGVLDANNEMQYYVGEVDDKKSATGHFYLRPEGGGDKDDYIEMRRPSFSGITNAWRKTQDDIPAEAAQFTIPALSDTSAGEDLVLKGLLPGVAEITIPAASLTDGDPAANAAAIVAAINGDADSLYVASVGPGNSIVLDAVDPGKMTEPTAAGNGIGAITGDPGSDVIGKMSLNPDGTSVFDSVDAADMNNPSAIPSKPSQALGLTGSAFAMRGGTLGGPQTIADMTYINIAPNGIITGLDSVGQEIIIGRIDLATFANPSGLNQAGSSNFMESANSGAVKLVQPGSGGAGGLVGGTLELSNVDLSREFSDMITTQRGYQANSRIITVSDTMMEELINLKR